MAAIPPLQSSSSSTASRKNLSYYSYIYNNKCPKFPSLLFKTKSQTTISIRIRCDAQNWSAGYVSAATNHHLHSIQNSSPSSFSIPSASSSSSESSPSKKVCLFYCAETKPLAQRIAAESDSIELRSISWRSFCQPFFCFSFDKFYYYYYY